MEKLMLAFSHVFLMRQQRRKFSSSPRGGKSCYSVAAVEGKSTPFITPYSPLGVG
jgi:hypothetical protein